MSDWRQCTHLSTFVSFIFIIAKLRVYLLWFLDPAVYPNFELYIASYSSKSTAIVKIAPVAKTRSERPSPQKQSVPKSDIVRSQKASPWRHVWPYQQVEDVTHPANVSLPVVYPRFDICEFFDVKRV